MMPGSFRRAPEIYVPHLENGFLHYLVTEIIAASDRKSVWVVKDATPQPLPTTTKPTSFSFVVVDDLLDSQQPSKD